MKLIFILTTLLISTWGLAQKNVELTAAADNTYGYTPENPLKLKRGNPGKSTNFAVSFLTRLETDEDQQLVLIRTSIIQDPKYDYPIRQLDIGRQTAFLSHRSPTAGDTPFAGDNLVERGLLQEYTFLTTATRDTVRVYVDIYHKDDLQIPKGLRVKGQEE